MSTGLALPRKLPNIWKPSFLHAEGPAFFLALLRVGSQPKDTFMSLRVSVFFPAEPPAKLLSQDTFATPWPSGVDSGWGGRPKKRAQAACHPVSWGWGVGGSGDVVGP